MTLKVKQTYKELFPKAEEINTKFRCFSCKKTFNGGEVLLEEIPSNFFILGCSKYSTACPHCNKVTITGFDLA